MKDQTPIDPLEIFKTRTRSRLLFEFEHYQQEDNLDAFKLIWTVNEALCEINNDELHIHI